MPQPVPSANLAAQWENVLVLSNRTVGRSDPVVALLSQILGQLVTLFLRLFRCRNDPWKGFVGIRLPHSEVQVLLAPKAASTYYNCHPDGHRY